MQNVKGKEDENHNFLLKEKEIICSVNANLNLFQIQFRPNGEDVDIHLTESELPNLKVGI
jgi:hypothetical protein